MFSHQSHKRKLIEAIASSPSVWKNLAAQFDINSTTIITHVGNQRSSMEFCERLFELLEFKGVTLSQLDEALKAIYLDHLIQPSFGFTTNESSNKRQKLQCTDMTDMKKISPIYLMAIAVDLKKFDKFFNEKQLLSDSHIYDHIKELCQENSTFHLSNVITYLQNFESVGLTINQDFYRFATLKKTKPSVEITSLLSEYASENKLFPLWSKLSDAASSDYDNSAIVKMQTQKHITLDKLFISQLHDILSKNKVKDLETLVNTFEEMIKLRKTIHSVGELRPLCFVHFANLVCLYQSQYELGIPKCNFSSVFKHLMSIQSIKPDLLETDFIKIVETQYDIREHWFDNHFQHSITKLDIDNYLSSENLPNLPTYCRNWRNLLEIWAPHDSEIRLKIESLQKDFEKLKELFYYAMRKKFTISKIVQDLEPFYNHDEDLNIKMSEI